MAVGPDVSDTMLRAQGVQRWCGGEGQVQSAHGAKLLYLGVRNHLTRQPAIRTTATNPGLPHTNGWKDALNQFEILWPGRLNPR